MVIGIDFFFFVKCVMELISLCVVFFFGFGFFVGVFDDVGEIIN